MKYAQKRELIEKITTLLKELTTLYPSVETAESLEDDIILDMLDNIQKDLLVISEL